MRKVLIANRGEIAVRLIRACHEMGLETVSVYSQADAEALHVLLSDEAICIGEAPAPKSYLKISSILAACEITGADAIHPGFGFLSENAHFASICESSGLNFIGPSSEAIALLGDKAAAKKTAQKVGCPVIEGSPGVVGQVEEGLKIAKGLGFPVFIKAVAGGGGKGIRIATDGDDFCRQFVAARTEAEINFGNPDIYLEKMVVNPRHVEFQVVGDKQGNYVHLGERDCTIQRRRQKLIEETPSPLLTPALRKKMGEAAVAIVKAANYHSVGTVEFLLDEQQNFYFMEVNTRIQVEHTITEELTGIDLVREQIKIARGETLQFKQSDISFQGHVLQLRINAEDPHNNFAPSPGLVKDFIPPGGPRIRLDTACFAGYKIPPYYDSMIAKLIIHGRDRADSIVIALRALREFKIGGVHTTIPFHLYMLQEEAFVQNRYFITHVDQLILDGCRFQT